MPELGGKKLANDFSTSFGGVRQMLAKAHAGMSDAVAELTAEARRVSESEKVVRNETSALKRMNDDVLGNAETTDQTVSNASTTTSKET